MKLKLNPEYARRHLFSALVLLALGGWFGYDGFSRYPALPAAELYESVEGSEPPAGFDLDTFKNQKIAAQRGLSLVLLFAALVVGVRLAKSARFSFEFDDEGYCFRGRRHAYAAVKKVDRSKWEKNDIITVNGLVLDAWHHLGVKEFVEKLDRASGALGSAEKLPAQAT